MPYFRGYQDLRSRDSVSQLRHSLFEFIDCMNKMGDTVGIVCAIRGDDEVERSIQGEALRIFPVKGSPFSGAVQRPWTSLGVDTREP